MEIFTIGHSNHPIEVFLKLLQKHGITAVADVRSVPYCQYHTQFSREPLVAALTGAKIAYVFLGKELGVRSDNPACYVDGKVQYSRLAAEPAFADGIVRLLKGCEKYRIALMCAEKDPIMCHRTILVGRQLLKQHLQYGSQLFHILADGMLEPHAEAESRLFKLHKIPEGDLFSSREELLEEAYDRQAKKIAYESPEEEL